MNEVMYFPRIYYQERRTLLTIGCQRFPKWRSNTQHIRKPADDDIRNRIQCSILPGYNVVSRRINDWSRIPGLRPNVEKDISLNHQLKSYLSDN